LVREALKEVKVNENQVFRKIHDEADSMPITIRQKRRDELKPRRLKEVPPADVTLATFATKSFRHQLGIGNRALNS
jgi:hypothetical protein